MIIQKFYVEAYVSDGVQIDKELDKQLRDDERCSWRNVVLISEEETEDTFPEKKEECIIEQLKLIESMLDDDDLFVSSEVGDKLVDITNNLRDVLSKKVLEEINNG